MDGIKDFKKQPIRALQDIVARCRPYFDRGESQLLSVTERQQYYAALFRLVECGGLDSMCWGMREPSRPCDDRQRASQGGRRPARRELAKSVA